MSNKYENSFSDSGLWEKNNGILSAIDSVSQVVNKAKEKIIIYHEKLDNKLYGDVIVFSSIEKQLINKIKVEMYYHEINELSGTNIIIDYFNLRYPDFFLCEQVTDTNRLLVNFIISDSKYVRIEFGEEQNKARYIVDDNEVKLSVAKRYIDSLEKDLKIICTSK